MIDIITNMDKSKYIASWKKENVKRYEFYVHKENEKELYEWIEQYPNKRQYILDLIEKDMKNEKKR